MGREKQLLTLKEASRWASHFLKREVSESSISYLIQYGKIKKRFKAAQDSRGRRSIFIGKKDLMAYYSCLSAQKAGWKKQLGQDLDWGLSFDHLRETATTKHVHRLHPYKGKFIPQLVQSLLSRGGFEPGDIVLDPFSGSGTTLVQAAEMGIHGIGLDISRFNCLIAEAKLLSCDISLLRESAARLRHAVEDFGRGLPLALFERELSASLREFNEKHFPGPEFKRRLAEGKISERDYGAAREKEFLKTYRRLIKKQTMALTIQRAPPPRGGPRAESFLDKWHLPIIRKELDIALREIQKIKDPEIKKILSVLLSRTARSCRATSHSDLATLKEPQTEAYYCWKHKKICRPLLSIRGRLKRYIKDSLFRIEEFSRLRTGALFAVLPLDARAADIFSEVQRQNKSFGRLLKRRKIRGICASPPYVGQIDYHEQHAYAYKLLGLQRADDLEIGPLFRGRGAAARRLYVEGIAQALRNCRRFMADDFDVFLVANDKFRLYPEIAERAGMRAANQFKRPVLNRAEKDQAPYAEQIFHLKPL